MSTVLPLRAARVVGVLSFAAFQVVSVPAALLEPAGETALPVAARHRRLLLEAARQESAEEGDGLRGHP